MRLGGGVPIDPDLLPDQSKTTTEQAGQFPKVDTLRRWTAPWPGFVDISAPVSLVGASIDGVRVTIEQFNPGVTIGDTWTPDTGTVLDAADLEPGNTAQQWPGGTPDVPLRRFVNRGDHIYFRVQSRDNGAGDEVAWDPQIQYAGVSPTLDVNGKDVFRYVASEDFTLAGRPGGHVTMPFDGKVRIQGSVTKPRRSTDDVTVVVIKNDVVVHSQKIDMATTGTFPVDFTWTSPAPSRAPTRPTPWSRATASPCGSPLTATSIPPGSPGLPG